MQEARVPPAASPLVSAVKRHPHALENVAYAPDSFICAHVGLPTSLLNLSHSLYMALPLFLIVSLSLFQVFRAVQTPLLDWALDPNAQRCAHVMFGCVCVCVYVCVCVSVCVCVCVSVFADLACQARG